MSFVTQPSMPSMTTTRRGSFAVPSVVHRPNSNNLRTLAKSYSLAARLKSLNRSLKWRERGRGDKSNDSGELNLRVPELRKDWAARSVRSFADTFTVCQGRHVPGGTMVNQKTGTMMSWNARWSVAASKDNDVLHPSIRDYFDRPCRLSSAT
ncbi:hypothetical protein FOZ61_002030 [Perkinsus olseni]|uniref:Uncharacterized protein n=1 Tax=Perkinsus olseni TaxID=32597 RepID=A0A7J6KNJ6_PEROL|nr:hypothetical protein FOZ61_002030 [Perkinsus olseni]